MILFIILLIVLLLILALHDWVSVAPLTDIEALSRLHSVKQRLFSTVVSSFFALIPLGFSVNFYPGPFPGAVVVCNVLLLGLLTYGTIRAWWIPYLFGSSTEHKAGFAEYKHTHHFLPARGDNVIPNTLHCIMHVLAWTCFAFSVAYLFS
jgi:hypothetical protein